MTTRHNGSISLFSFVEQGLTREAAKKYAAFPLFHKCVLHEVF